MNKTQLFNTFHFILFGGLIILLSSCNPENIVLFQSKDFTIFSNRIEQDKHKSIAKNNETLISNYPYKNKVEHKWELQRNLSNYPKYESNFEILNAIYQLSLEELEFNISSDSIFNTGEKWQGVWTRDISYSTILSLAIVNPELCMKSLLKKVKNSRIVQDTGTGGSSPVSSDRMIWSTAAWEIYLYTGDKDWLRRVYFIIKNSTDDDLNVVWDYKRHLFKGESSFLDWREQSYPKWMEPIDIYNSYSLSTQAVHYRSLQVLIEMGKLLNKDVQKYQHISNALKKSINEKFWLKDQNYFGAYLYGKEHLHLAEQSESLGEALCVLWDIADNNKQKLIVSNTPQTSFGIPCFFPQIPHIPPYHNQAIWPFVQAYWINASAKVNNVESMKLGMANIFRSTALFLTNKENYLIDSGDFSKTEINSDRQLWSITGTLSIFFKNLLGLHFTNEQMEFHPKIPREYKGKQVFRNLRYRNAILDIEILGFGNQIESYFIDGVEYRQAIIPKNFEGKHQVKIMMNNQFNNLQKINLQKNHTAPETPVITYQQKQLQWKEIEHADHYKVYRNGKLFQESQANTFQLYEIGKPIEYYVQTIDSSGYSSFISKPVFVFDSIFHREIEPEIFSETKKSYVKLSKKKNQTFYFQIIAPRAGTYKIDFLYANGSGPINTDNKCAIRSFWANNTYQGSLVFPQRGKENWKDYGYSNAFEVALKYGINYFKISFEKYNENMNQHINLVHIDKVRIIRIES